MKAMLEARIVAANIQGCAFSGQGSCEFPERIAASSQGVFIELWMLAEITAVCFHIVAAEKYTFPASRVVPYFSRNPTGALFPTSQVARFRIPQSRGVPL
jgi:hypothetical protein